MRPLRLTLEGFRSYQQRVSFDFEGRQLIGIVGPTGSGKSSLLDAITFALYGRTPAEGRAVTKLINGRSAAAQVELWFTAGNETLRAVRSLRRKGSSGQTLERWDTVEGTKLETIADKRAEMNSHVEAVLGLDFDAFTRSLLLAQGRFAQLLVAAPAEAAKVLTGLFGFGIIEDMRDVVTRRLIEVRAELVAAEKARAAQQQVTDALASAETETESAARRAEALAAIHAEVTAGDRILEGLRAEAKAVGEALGALQDARAGLPAVDVTERVLAEAAGHASLVASAEAARTAAEASLQAAQVALDEAVRRDMQGAIAQLSGAMDSAAGAVDALDKASSAVDAAHTAARDASDHVKKAHDAVARAEADQRGSDQRRDEAARLLAALESDHAAHVLAEGLVVGDDCPICRRPLDSVPEIGAPAGLESAREELARARAAAEKAAGAVSTARSDHAVAIQRAAGAETELARAVEAHRVAKAAAGKTSAVVIERVVALGGDPSDPAGALHAATLRWQTLVGDRDAASAAATEAVEAVGRLTSVDVATRLTELAGGFATAVALLGAAPLPDRIDEIGAAIAALRAALDAAITDGTSSVTAADERVRLAAAERHAILEEAGLDAGVDVSATLTEARRLEAKARGRSDLLAEQVDAGAAAIASAAETSALALRLQGLNADLAPGKFPQFLLDERRRELAAAGSEWFRDLSSGRYEFELEDNLFRIRELTSAGLVRDADTLSGGETFLASLSLALGLATMVGMGGGALDSFFIDEGFGSLDADSLDLAMEGVEKLVAGDSGRLVVVVSHVPELRERIDDLIILAKDHLTNETRILRA